jgi:hypothetical protein
MKRLLELLRDAFTDTKLSRIEARTALLSLTCEPRRDYVRPVEHFKGRPEKQ